jgi:hypothetical protein
LFRTFIGRKIVEHGENCPTREPSTIHAVSMETIRQ